MADLRNAVRSSRRATGGLLVLAVLTVALSIVLAPNWYFSRPGSPDGAGRYPSAGASGYSAMSWLPLPASASASG